MNDEAQTETPQRRTLGRNDFIGSASRRILTNPVPWDTGQQVRIRSLNDSEQSAYEVENLNDDGSPSAERLANAKRRLVALTVVDDNDKPFLTPADVKAMEDTDGKLIAWVFGLAQKHCNIDATEKKPLVAD